MTNKANKTDKAPCNYPFESKAQVAAKLTDSFEYRCDAMIQLLALQTEYEQEKSTTVDKNRVGFMSSHAVNGTRVAKKLITGEELTPEDVVHVDRIAPHYSRQLAAQARRRAIAANPELAVTAAVFGV